MAENYLVSFDAGRLKTPAFVVDEAALRRNLTRVDEVRERSGAKVLMALKAFALPAVFPLLREHMDGVCSSSPYESRLGREKFGGHVHAFAPAYSREDLQAQLELADHIVFNSLRQWREYRPQCASRPGISPGLRINPMHSETAVAIYDPCAPGSRLGIPISAIGPDEDLEGIEGLHVHTLCQKGADAFARTAEAFEKQCAPLIGKMKWLNFGGGHSLTNPDYDLDLLCSTLMHFSTRYGVQVYIEPGESIIARTGSLFATVLDIVGDGSIPAVILDISATCHMPDVIEMPYRPDVRGALPPETAPWTCRLGGLSCLAGDVIGDYGFERPLEPGQVLELLDMSQYTFVKSTFFNGLHHPSLAVLRSNGDLEVVREFGYADFLSRLM